jgi:hypothetical protein
MIYLRSYSATIVLHTPWTMLPDSFVPSRLRDLDTTCPVPRPLLHSLYSDALLDKEVPPARRYTDRNGLCRSSRVKSSASMSLATLLAALCARSCANDRQALTHHDRVGVYIGSALPALDPAHQYETRGLTEGWGLIDPFRLPHCIPSSLAATVAIQVGAKGSAFTCLDGHLASLRAIDRAAIALCYGEIDQAFVGGAEEVSDMHLAALAGAGLSDYASTPGNRTFEFVAEGASIGLLQRNEPLGAAEGVGIDGYCEIVGEIDQKSSQLFGQTFCEGRNQRFDRVFSMFGRMSAGSASLRALLGSLRLEIETEWLGDIFGDLHGACAAFALSRAIEEGGWSRALIHCAGRLQTTGLLMIRKLNA